MRPLGGLGVIVTFYSYKGGTGRTMALANLGYLLAREGQRVLTVDWDLEAPGLHRYFHRLVNDENGTEFDSRPGLIDLFGEIAEAVAGAPGGGSEKTARALLANVPLESYVLQTDVAGLSLLKAGRFDESYPARVCDFRWQELHARSPWLFRAFAEQIAAQFDYVLIDSRTGLTDTSGICTSILPDKLVVVFTPNRQSLLGALGVVREATRYRKDSDDLRPLTVFPLVSRVETTEPQLRASWRFGSPAERIPGYQRLFEDLFREVYDLPECSLDTYFNETQIQHVPWFAYGEEIAARIEAPDRLSLTRSFEHFGQYLTGTAAPWQAPGPEPAIAAGNAAEPASLRDKWMAAKREQAEAGVKKMDLSGLMEASFVPAPSLDAIGQKRLFEAAKAAQVPGTGWPIGAVVTVSEQSRPRPEEDGLVAEILDKQTASYDLWALRTDGSFYFARHLEEDDDCLLTDDRIERVLELLLYCRRLYTFLGVDKGGSVRISIRFSGLQGRFLATRVPDRADALMQVAGTSTTDTMAAEALVTLEALQQEIVKLVKQLTRPLFWLFRFHEVKDGEYETLVAYRLREWGALPAEGQAMAPR